MNIRQLKDLIENMDDSICIFREYADHNMIKCDIGLGTVIEESKNHYMEDFGEELTPESIYGKRIKALIIG